MPENAPTQPNSNRATYDPAQVSRHYLQQQLAEQGINVSPEEAPKLFWQKYIHDIRLEIQQDLAERGIDVSPDEAAAIGRLQLYHRLMRRTVIADPHEAT